jgi:hypothetical protein
MTLIELESNASDQSSIWINVEEISRLHAANHGGTAIVLRDGSTLDTPEDINSVIHRLKSALGVIVAERFKQALPADK